MVGLVPATPSSTSRGFKMGMHGSKAGLGSSGRAGEADDRLPDFRCRQRRPAVGAHLPQRALCLQTYGTLNADKSNVIVYPTSYGAQHPDLEWQIGPGRALDPTKYFIVIMNKFGNGLS